MLELETGLSYTVIKDDVINFGYQLGNLNKRLDNGLKALIILSYLDKTRNKKRYKMIGKVVNMNHPDSKKDISIFDKNKEELKNVYRLFKQRDGSITAEQYQTDDDGEVVVTIDGEHDGILSRSVDDVEVWIEK